MWDWCCTSFLVNHPYLLQPEQKEMSMKKIILAMVLILIIAVSTTGYAGMFDSIKSAIPGTGGSGLSRGDIDAYFQLSKKADDLHQASIDSLSQMLVNKDAADQIDRKMKAAQATQDPKEKEAAMKQVLTEKEALLEQQLNSKDSEEKLAKLDANQKKLAGAAISNLFLSVLINKSAVDVAKGIVQKAQANPSAAVGYTTELPRIKDAVVVLPGKIEKTYTLGNQLLKLAKTGNIEVTMPQSATDKPVEVTL